jgi:hypothetical protein
MWNKIDRSEKKKKKKKGLDVRSGQRGSSKKGKKGFLAVASLILIFAKLTVVRCATDRRSRYNSVWNGLQRQRACKLVSIVPPRTLADPEKQKRRHHSSRHGNVR